MHKANTSMLDSNQRVYEDKKVAHSYLKENALFPAEQTILELFKPHLHELTMLDIGIGGGRTTVHFSTRVKKYVGIDYSSTMIELCENRFAKKPESVEFRVCDVRDLAVFANHSFDLVLFSYNGLDYISHDDRLLALAEMCRVTKVGGSLILSSHNLLSLGAGTQGSRKFWLKRRLVQILIHLLNGRLSKLKDMPYALIRDDGLGFRLKTYYVSPSEQIRQFSLFGLNQVEIYGREGRQLSQEKIGDENKVEWLYYRATLSSNSCP